MMNLQKKKVLPCSAIIDTPQVERNRMSQGAEVHLNELRFPISVVPKQRSMFNDILVIQQDS